MADHRTSAGRGIDLIWPGELLSPFRPPILIYLDLNHWINLAKASLQRGSPQYDALLLALRAARSRRSIRIVLSISLVEELSAIKNPRQRDELVALIDELSDFEYLAGLGDVFRLELQTFLNTRMGGRGMGWNPIPLVGRSMLHGFGKVGDLKILKDATGEDITDQARAKPFRGDPSWFEKLERRAERELLAGPRDSDIEELRAAGYRPERPRQSHHNNVLIEQYFADELLDQHWRKGRLLDVVAARHVSLELIDMLTVELMARAITLSEVMSATTHVLELPLSMPASAVFVGIKTQYHRDRNRKWTDNDLHDISAMALAIPYCDVVYTDASVRNAAITAGLDKLMGTRLPRSPLEMAQLVEQANGESPSD